MSLLGFDATGRLALGQLPRSPYITLRVDTQSYTLTANSVTLKATDNISPAAFVIAAQGVTLKEIEAVSANSFALTASTVSFKLVAIVSPAFFAVTTNPTTEPEVEYVGAASYAITFNDVPLIWTGAGIDTSYTGGVGHFLEEIERQKRLNAITRKIPGPVDRRTVPRFAPLQAPPSAPAAPAPDMAAIQNQRMAEAAAQARIAKRRRDEEAVLLLAS
jgi:hypothetical protein